MSNKNKKQDLIHMLRRNPLIVLSAAGLTLGIVFAFTYGQPKTQTPNQLTLPASSPFDKNISGIGIVEANSRNINIGADIPGIVREVFVAPGQKVQKDDPLFKLDTDVATEELELRRKEIEVSVAQLEIARVLMNDAKDQYERSLRLKKGVEISIEEKQKRAFAYAKAQADYKKSEADVSKARTAFKLQSVKLDQLIFRAPTDGLILKVNAKLGELVGNAGQNMPIIIMGNSNPLHVRVQIDEYDAWRLKPGKAKAYLKGNSRICFDLSFVRIDPYAAPKRQISGDIQEFVDTRVIEVVYRIEGNTDHVYIGQKLDIYIESTESL